MAEMKNRLLRIVFAVIFATVSLTCGAVGASWDTLKTEYSEAKSIVTHQDIEIRTLPNRIIININHSEKVEVFTILGRLVSSEILSQGSYVLPISVHGVYIIKVGELTCKVAI